MWVNVFTSIKKWEIPPRREIRVGRRATKEKQLVPPQLSQFYDLTASPQVKTNKMTAATDRNNYDLSPGPALRWEPPAGWSARWSPPSRASESGADAAPPYQRRWACFYVKKLILYFKLLSHKKIQLAKFAWGNEFTLQLQTTTWIALQIVL